MQAALGAANAVLPVVYLVRFSAAQKVNCVLKLNQKIARKQGVEAARCDLLQCRA